MSSEAENKAIVGLWFTKFWGRPCKIDIVDELAASDMLLQYSMRTSRRGHEDVKAFMTRFREAFPDLEFRSTGDLTADRNFVIVHWEGGGTHIDPAFGDFHIGPLPAGSGRKIRLTGHTAVRVENGKIVEEAVWARGRKVHMRNLIEASGPAE